jgi:hypothetical protein
VNVRQEKVRVRQEKMDDFAKMVFGRETRRPPKQWSEWLVWSSWSKMDDEKGGSAKMDDEKGGSAKMAAKVRAARGEEA